MCLRVQGLHSTTDVKTNSSRFPLAYLRDNVGQESGDWLALTSTDVNGNKMYCLGHRRGGTVHYFVSSCGTTDRGKDQKHKEDLLTVEGLMAPRKAPKIVNDITKAQPVVDSHNDLRQHVLAIEEAFRTDSFPMRFMTTLIGIEFIDTYRANQYYNGDTRTLKPALNELFYNLMTNNYDESRGVGGCSKDRQGNVITTGPGAPGARSPIRTSPRTLAKKHVLVPLKSIVGWTGTSSQLLCSICGDKTTSVCIECSDKESVVPLCKRVHTYQERTILKQCYKRHYENPDESRRSYSRSGGKKRTMTMVVQGFVGDE